MRRMKYFFIHFDFLLKFRRGAFKRRPVELCFRKRHTLLFIVR